mmetsp:Transcript_46447/g.140690  ORF Transcript_46447/g.140690 Transcript_46447/m.140690 type:complete len:110 (-) Transcript_46447:130-459(-)
MYSATVLLLLLAVSCEAAAADTFPDIDLGDRGDLSAGAICYAERYPFINQEVCGGSSAGCDAKILHDHYEKWGKPNNLTWGCSNLLSELSLFPNFTPTEGRCTVLCRAI